MTCPHIEECDQYVSKDSCKEFCSQNSEWDQDECFEHNELARLDANEKGVKKTPKEWSEASESG